MHCQQLTFKIHHTSYQILQAKPVLSPDGINFATLF